MSKASTYTILATLLTSFVCSPLIAEKEPAIKAVFHDAESLHLLSHLKHLNNQDPEFNKLILSLKDYPKNKEIIFEVKRLAGNTGDKYVQIAKFIIQDDGSYLTSTEPKQRLDSFISTSKGFLPGERVFYRFRTADGTVDKEISGVPSPAIFRDNDGRIALRAELIQTSPTLYEIKLPTMNEGEVYKLKSTSVGTTVTAEPTYTASKPIHYAPTAGKGKGGQGILEIKRKSGEIYYLTLPWGTALTPCLQGKKPSLYH